MLSPAVTLKAKIKKKITKIFFSKKPMWSKEVVAKSNNLRDILIKTTKYRAEFDGKMLW